MQKNTNNIYGIPTSLLRFLGACVYGDAAAYYSGLNEAERAELDNQGRSFGLTAWFYRYLYDVLPEKKKMAYQKNYHAQQLKAMIGVRELKRLYCVLASHGLRFVPIKGADLAFRLYPDAALRSFCDWDIWFHPDDCERALAVLAEDGWKVPESCKESSASKTALDNYHHYQAHFRGNYMLEPHFTLSRFRDIDPLEMWEYSCSCPDSEGQLVLTPEMNLLMLARHASSLSFLHASIPKLLTDAAMVLQKEKVDFSLLRRMSERWSLPYPGDLFAAFPEFFPSDIVSNFKADPEATANIRKIFSLRAQLGKEASVALAIKKCEDQGNFSKGILKQILAQTPRRIRSIYHLPEHGAWIRVCWGYACWFWTRTWRARIWIRKNPVFLEYLHHIKDAESV